MSTDINSVSSTGYISFDQFVEYYENVGAFLDDNTFDSTVKSVWRPSALAGGGSPRNRQHRHHHTEKSLSEQLSASNAMNESISKDSLVSYLPSLQELKLALKARGFYGVIRLGRAFRSIDTGIVSVDFLIK